MGCCTSKTQYEEDRSGLRNARSTALREEALVKYHRGVSRLNADNRERLETANRRRRRVERPAQTVALAAVHLEHDCRLQRDPHQPMVKEWLAGQPFPVAASG